jgi:EmrB/QacA subfamily drug resistance transporter
VLATVCLAVFAIDLDTTIVNVALPSLSRQLGAGTSTLQWVVDGYSLAFAALVLTGGSLGDRFGRRPVLVTGLLGFAAASALGGVVHQAGALVVLRFAMGAFDALICPTTLSVIISAYRDRAGRARAIGVWGAVTGLSVAVGPVTGGLLLAHFWYGSVFWALVPVALIAAIATMLIVPESRQPGAARIDLPGLLVSSAAIGLLVYTIIEAPDRGWGAASSIAGFAGTALLGTAFAVVERHTAEPMLDLTLFKVPAFSAASGSLTIAFFALFGFIFLVTQYFQFIRGYGPLSTGVRILPVALSIAAGSAAGSSLVVRIGTRVIVTCGLIMFGLVFAWIAGSPAREPYPQIAAQMVIMGTALGLISTPATESILSVLPPARAGTGSAVNDATREAGGALGVAVIGSVFSSMYLHKLATTPMVALPASGYAAARSSVAAALGIARHTPDSLSLTQDVTSSFMAGLHVACVVVALVCWAGAGAALRLPGRQSAAPRNHSDEAIDAGSTVVAGLPAPTGQTLIPYVTPPQEALPTSSSSRRS